MDASRLFRAAIALAVVAALAVVLGTGLRTVFHALGASAATATKLSVAIAVSVALALSDAFTPLGRGPIPELREKPPGALALDLVLTALAAVAAAGLFVVLGTIGPAVLAREVVAVIAGVIAGYGLFFYRNREHYGFGPPDRT